MKIYPIVDKTMKAHFSNSYLIKFLIMVCDLETKEEIHSEEVCATFINREEKNLHNLAYVNFNEIARIEYWLRKATYHQLECVKKGYSNIFFTKNQKEKFEQLVKEISKHKKTMYDSCHIETIKKQDPLEIKELVKELRNKPNSIVWLGEFI